MLAIRGESYYFYARMIKILKSKMMTELNSVVKKEIIAKYGEPDKIIYLKSSSDLKDTVIVFKQSSILLVCGQEVQFDSVIDFCMSGTRSLSIIVGSITEPEIIVDMGGDFDSIKEVVDTLGIITQHNKATKDGKEIVSVNYLIGRTNLKVSNLKKRETPDFELCYNDKITVGLEHTAYTNANSELRNIKKLFAKVEGKLRDKIKSHSFRYHCQVREDFIPTKSKDISRGMVDEFYSLFCDIIDNFSAIQSNVTMDDNKFITHVRREDICFGELELNPCYSPNRLIVCEEIEFGSNDVNTYTSADKKTKDDTNKTINQLIWNKNINLQKYDKVYDERWLLIDMLQPTELNRFNPFKIKCDEKTLIVNNFDRIYIITKFGVHQLK